MAPLTITGTLEPVGDDAEAAPLSGYRVELLFKRKVETEKSETGTPDSSETATETAETSSRVAPSETMIVDDRVSSMSDERGQFKLTLPEGVEAEGSNVRLLVSAPSGETLEDRTVETNTLGEPLTVAIKPVPILALEAVTETAQSPLRRVGGRVLDLKGKTLPAGLQVVIMAKPAGAAVDTQAQPVMVARVDRNGAFFGDAPNVDFDEAIAVVPGVATAIPLPLENGRITSNVLLPLEIDDSVEIAVADDDCGCGHGVVPRMATHDDIALSPETFTADLGDCGCVQFNKPNRAVEEFDFFSVVRTTEPQVRRVTLAQAERPPANANGGSPNGRPDTETVTPVVALAYDVKVETRELDGGAVFQVSLLSADGKRHVLLRKDSSADGGLGGLFGSGTASTGVIRLGDGSTDPEDVVNRVSPSIRSWPVYENAYGGAPIGLDLRTVRQIEVLGATKGEPWALCSIGISASTSDGAQTVIRIEGDEFYEGEPWLKVFSSEDAFSALPWTANAGIAVAAAYAATAAGGPQITSRPPLSSAELAEIRRVRETAFLPATGRDILSPDVAVDWDETPTFTEAATVAHGHLLQFKQQWFADGYSFGDLLYSLPLAPGQKKLISIVDWERRETTQRVETTTGRESLDALVSRDRDLGEVVTGALSESMQGGSRNTTAGVGVGTGAAGNGSYQGMNFGALVGVSGGYGESDSSAWQVAGKTVAADSLQTLRDKTVQSASAVRSLRTSVVQTVSQGESTRVTTEVVANHNHCHALTIQYFEVLRHLSVRHTLVDVRECLFVPLPITRFDGEKTLRWRSSLETYLRAPELSRAFDATRRVQTDWKEVDYPAGRYADEPVTEIRGELELTVIIPLPPLPEKPKPRPEDTAKEQLDAIDQATKPAADFFTIAAAVLTGGASLAVQATTSKVVETTKATLEGAQALAREMVSQPTPQEAYEKFQHEVMPGLAAGFVDQLDLYALVAGSEMQIGAADFTLVSEYRPGVPLLVSVSARFPANIKRGDIQELRIKSRNGLPTGCRAIVNSASVRYRTRLFEHPLVDDRRANDDIDLPVVELTGLTIKMVAKGNGAALSTPTDPWEQRNPRTEDRALTAALLEHINEHLEFYHHAIWWTMDPNRRYMLLDGFEAPGSGGRSIASVVDNRLIGIVGNSLVLPVANGVFLDPRIKAPPVDGSTNGSTNGRKPSPLLSLYDIEPLPPASVALPTRGVFAEAVMGQCNACEQIDESRFWRWEDSPIDEPPGIATASTETRRAEPPSVTPTAFPTPIVSIQNAPDIPTPAGVAAVLDSLGKQVFADITGLEGTQANAAMAYGKALDTALAFGKEASTLAQQAGMMKGGLRNTMEAIDQAHSEGKIDDKQRNELSLAALKKMIGDDGEGMSTRDVKDLTDTAGDNNAKVSVSKPTGENVDIDAKQPEGTTPPEKDPKRPAARPPTVERVVRVFSTYPGSSAPVAGLYDFAFEDVASRKKDGGSFQVNVGTPIGQLRVGLPAGEWSVIARIEAFLPLSITKVPVSVVPGLDPFDFTVSQELAGSTTPLQIIGGISVKPSMRVVDIRLKPVVEEITVEREIELSTSATASAEFQAETKEGVELAANELIAQEKVTGEIAFGAKLGLSGTVGAGQTLKLTITYKKIVRFEFV